MKKLFNVDQLSVMILAGVIMALAWGCKREAKAINDVACESTSNNVDLVFITNYYGLITVDDGNLLVSDICLNTNSLNIDDLFLTIDDSFIVTVDDGCKINTPKGKYIVTNGVIEEVVKPLPDIMWMEPRGAKSTFDLRVLFGFGEEINGDITNRIYGRLGVKKVDDRHVVIWEQVE